MENTLLENTRSENTLSDNMLSENTLSENTRSENTLSENTISENTLSENTLWVNTLSENTVSENTLSNFKKSFPDPKLKNNWGSLSSTFYIGLKRNIIHELYSYVVPKTSHKTKSQINHAFLFQCEKMEN